MKEIPVFRRMARIFTGCLIAAAAGLGAGIPRVEAAEEVLVTDGDPGVAGGRLVFAQRAEPKTLDPVTAVDIPSREVIRLMTADLIHINRASQKTESALAKSWVISRDGRRYTLQLRRGLRFSDGHPMTAEDVAFTFRVYLDESVHSPQRDMLLVGGKPIVVTATGPDSIQVDLSQPYAVTERLFDGIPILPRHLLESAYREGKLPQAWGLSTSPAQIAGMGPFRFKQCVPGDRIVLERNPYYWKVDRNGTRLPYLEEIVLLSVPSEDAQAIRFQAGETDLITRISAENYAVLAREERGRGYRLYDLGPGLEYNFLFFNLNDLRGRGLAAIERKQAWFRKDSFRRAISAAIDREGMVRLAYQGRATPLFGHVTAGNKLWRNESIPRPPRSAAKARELLAAGGFKWKTDGSLVDSAGSPVEFTILTSAGNTPRMQMATMAQSDLKEIGISVQVVPLEFRSLIDRVLKSADYEACLLGLTSGDADPNPEMNVLLSSGGTHVWHPSQKQPETPWEAEIDGLMQRQVSVTDFAERKRLYDRVQQLMAEKLPLIYLTSPSILVGAKETLGNFKPAILDPYALWNVDQLYWRAGGAGAEHD